MKLELLRELINDYRLYLLEATDATIVEGDEYEALLDRNDITEIECWDLAYTMCDTLLDQLDAPLAIDMGPEEKMQINRWLGFIQGLMWSSECRTVNQMRDESRPIFKG